ncbi:MAG: sulfite exporter TauE/SafE family protein [Candidatus Falkowbacteria bacterium]|nr:sulfite exporter TauE/SafE family protein [Candidatus Falkowbacteria bacterium]
MTRKINVKLSGLHCQSCKILIETEVRNLNGVNNIGVDYPGERAKIEFDEKKISEQEIFKTINKLGYQIDAGAKKNDKRNRPWLMAAILLILFVVIYFLIARFGFFEILSHLNEKNLGFSLIFLIGLLVGFHCVGMCGGLVVAYTTKYMEGDGNKKITLPHLQYNLGRIISYTVIGGVLGGIGSFFGINPIFNGVVIIMAGAFMILMGLSFLKQWSVLEKIKIRTPQFIAKYLFNQKHKDKSKGPFVIGLLNGFMPCGPLQAIELYALSTGSIVRGALSMGVFVLGTIPVMFSFGLFISSIGQNYINRIIKVSGALIIILGILMLNRGLGNFGFNLLPSMPSAKPDLVQSVERYQEVRMNSTSFGYQPNVLYIKKGVPVRWIINVKRTGCNNVILAEALGINQELQNGENVIEFTPPKNAKEIKFSCGMKMIWGKFIIEDK